MENNLIIQCRNIECQILENTNGYFISGENDNIPYPLIKYVTMMVVIKLLQPILNLNALL